AGRTARVAATSGPALAAAHRVADRVHRRATVVRLAAEPALPAGLAQRDIHVVGIPDHANGPPAGRRQSPYLTGRQRDLRPRALAGGQRRAGSGGPAHLPAAARLELDIVNAHAEWDLLQRQAVADARLDFLTADDPVA